MSDDPLQFYDALASDYDRLFADWRNSVRIQGNIFDHMIRTAWRREAPPVTVLDCTCGIGTQALGLAQHGYTVTATDLSAEAVARAAREAEALELPLTTGVADVRTLAEQVAGEFDVVLSADNALPHLRGSDLRRAMKQIHAKTAPGGLFIGTIRDYDALCEERPTFTSERVMNDADGRRIVFQMWDWADDGRQYTVNQFILREREGGWETSHYATVYYPLRREVFTLLLKNTGFTAVAWLMPEASSYYQPAVLAWKPAR
jgi:SAM-dependent methyltransferase